MKVDKILKGYKFRIYPTKDQENFFKKHFNACRYVWNYFLETKSGVYKNTGLSLSWYDMAAGLTQIKKMPELTWLQEVNAQSIQQEIRKLSKTYSQFFKKTQGFPKFKTKRDGQSFMVPAGIKLSDGLLKIYKLDSKIKVNQHREFGQNARILFLTIKRYKANKYYVIFQVEEDKIHKCKKTSKIGIDLGLKNIVTISNGSKIKNDLLVNPYRKKLDYWHNQFCKKSPSKNREKDILRFSRVNEKINNRKLDFIHKLTSKIINDNQVICMENLNVKGMMKNKYLVTAFRNTSLHEVKRQLEYKAKWNSRDFVKVDRFFSSSKTCGNCGHIHQNLSLSDRTWQCVKCETTHDRDLNAARNILTQGLNILANLPKGKRAKSSVSGMESDVKQKHGEAFPSAPDNKTSEQGESMNHDIGLTRTDNNPPTLLSQI